MRKLVTMIACLFTAATAASGEEAHTATPTPKADQAEVTLPFSADSSIPLSLHLNVVPEQGEVDTPPEGVGEDGRDAKADFESYAHSIDIDGITFRTNSLCGTIHARISASYEHARFCPFGFSLSLLDEAGKTVAAITEAFPGPTDARYPAQGNSDGWIPLRWGLLDRVKSFRLALVELVDRGNGAEELKAFLNAGWRAERRGHCITIAGQMGGRSFCDSGLGTDGPSVYAYRRWIREINMHVIARGGNEEHSTLLVEPDTGCITELDAEPSLSPDQKRLATAGEAEMDYGYRARILTVTKTGAEIEWDWKSDVWLHEAKWNGPDEVWFLKTLLKNGVVEKGQVVEWLKVKLIDGKWKIQE